MNKSPPCRQQGFLLIAVVVILGVLATMALMLSTSTAMDNALVARHAEGSTLDYLAESGMAHTTWQLAQTTSCSGYSDLPVTVFGDHSYSASIVPNADSPVSIVATATLENGASMSLGRDSVKVYEASSTITLQPGPEGEDAEIWEQSPNNNYGDSAEAWVSSANNDTTRALLRFNMDAIPPGATVLGATLSLSRQSGSGPNQLVSAHRIANQWSENGVTWDSRESGTNWDTAGGDFENMPIVTTPVGPGGQRHEWNLTPLVQGWVDGRYPNYGVALVAAIAGMSGERFYTSDAAQLDQHPSLSVTYACECGTDCANAAETTMPMLVSFEGSVVADLQTFAPGDGFHFDPSTPAAQPQLVGSDHLVPTDANLTAVFMDTDGSYVLSTRNGVTAGGNVFSGGDVFRLDPSDNSSTLLLPASRLNSGIRVDAVHMLDSNTLIFSIDSDVAIDGDDYYRDDLIAYNFSSDSVSRYLDGLLLFPSGIGNVDATHVFPSGVVALSFESAETVAGISVDPDDLLLFDQATQTGSLYYDNTQIVQSGAGQENLDALFLAIEGSPLIGDMLTDGGTGCTGQYSDDFSGADYSANMGSLTFATDWLEVGESDGPDKGNVRIKDDSGEPALQVRHKNNGEDGIKREFDLTSTTAATLTFTSRRKNLKKASEYVSLSVSANGGASWTELDRYEGPDTDATPQSQSYDLSAYRSANTRIRFLSAPTKGDKGEVFFDDVIISLSGCP